MIGLKHIINIAVPSFLWVLWSSCKTCLQRQGWEKIILSSIELFFPGNLVAYKYVEGCCNDCDADRPPPHALLRFLVEEGSPRPHVSLEISCYVMSVVSPVLGRVKSQFWPSASQVFSIQTFCVASPIIPLFRFAIIQFLAMTWYAISYIPYAR